MTDATNDEARVAEIRARADAATAYTMNSERMGTDADLAAFIDDQRAKEELARTDVPWLLDQRDRYKAAVDAVLDEADALDEIASEFSLTETEAAGLRMAARGIRNAVTEALGGEL